VAAGAAGFGISFGASVGAAGATVPGTGGNAQPETGVAPQHEGAAAHGSQQSDLWNRARSRSSRPGDLQAGSQQESQAAVVKPVKIGLPQQ
jgi:hypothetical protein